MKHEVHELYIPSSIGLLAIASDRQRGRSSKACFTTDGQGERAMCHKIVSSHGKQKFSIFTENLNEI